MSISNATIGLNQHHEGKRTIDSSIEFLKKRVWASSSKVISERCVFSSKKRKDTFFIDTVLSRDRDDIEPSFSVTPVNFHKAGEFLAFVDVPRGPNKKKF